VRALDMPNARERSDDALEFGPRARPELLPWGTD
jgi:hypothetical protein